MHGLIHGLYGNTDRLDADGSGYLEAAEITEMVRLLGLTPTEEELQVCIAEMERGGGASPSSADGS